MADRSDIFTLHRYFIWANRMRTHLDAILSRTLKDKSPTDLQAAIEGQKEVGWTPSGEEDIEIMLYMSYWYGGLYVVIEGWKELDLHDDAIDRLLESPNVDLLRRYRNGVFHFQRKYFNEHFLGFMRDGKSAVEWVRDLNRAFGDFFLLWLRSHRTDQSST